MGHNFPCLWQMSNIRRLLFNQPQLPPTNSKETEKKGGNTFLVLWDILYPVPLPSFISSWEKYVHISPEKWSLRLRKWIRIMCFTSTGYEEVPNSLLKCKNLYNHCTAPSWAGLLSRTPLCRRGQLSQTSFLRETDKDAQINQTPKSGIVLWEFPHLDKGVWKTERNSAETGCWLAKPNYVT